MVKRLFAVVGLAIVFLGVLLVLVVVPVTALGSEWVSCGSIVLNYDGQTSERIPQNCGVPAGSINISLHVEVIGTTDTGVWVQGWSELDTGSIYTITTVISETMDIPHPDPHSYTDSFFVYYNCPSCVSSAVEVALGYYYDPAPTPTPGDLDGRDFSYTG